ncbi:MAG: sugar ABC transporter substrate-binding protein [Firmicutes bacterium]|nr:sugar ABC transporter substrate-binding protein [Bacillota bacterium]
MKKMWRTGLLGLICLLVLMTSMATISAPVTITFWAMTNAPDEVHIPWVEGKAAEFERQTGIKVNFEQIGWDDAWQKITTAFVTGEGADVFQVGTTWNPQFAAAGGLEELNIAEFGGKDAFMKANFESTTYKGKCYGVPWFAETRALFYNVDMFNKAGVQPPKTHDELLKVSAKIVETFGEGSAIALAGTNAWDLLHNWSIILWANGGQLLTNDNKYAMFNNEAGVSAMKWYVDLVRKGYASKACAEYNQPQADAAFVNGNVAMCYMGPWNIANIELENPSLNYGVVEPPAGPKGKASFSGGSNLAILKASRNKEAAKAWIKFLLKTENMVEYTRDLTHMLPAQVEVFADPYYDSGVWKTFKTTLEYATAYPTLGVWGDIENAVQQEFAGVLAAYVNGTYDENTVKLYLNRAADKVNEALKREK